LCRRTFSRTQIMKFRTFMICVRDFVGNLFRTLSQSRRNGIWALQSFVCPSGPSEARGPIQQSVNNL